MYIRLVCHDQQKILQRSGEFQYVNLTDIFRKFFNILSYAQKSLQTQKYVQILKNSQLLGRNIKLSRRLMIKNALETPNSD